MKEQIRIMRFTLIFSTSLMLIKFAAWWLTNSNAIFTDALESIVNVAAGTFALYSITYAARPRDEDHPYGHGKIEFLSAGFEGGMILLAGVAMMIKGISAFFTLEKIDHADIGAYFSGIAGLINLFLALYLKSQSKKTHSEVLKAEAAHLYSDAVSSLGLIIGLSIIYFTLHKNDICKFIDK